MKFSVVKNGILSPGLKLTEQLIMTFIRHGHCLTEDTNDIKFVLNLTSIENPQIFRRQSKGIFVITFVMAEKSYPDLRATCYQTLIRSLSNLLVCMIPCEDTYDVYFTTPEVGFYHIPFDSESIYNKILPIAGAHFAMDNKITTDLPSDYWKSTPIVDQIKQYGRELDKLGVLPTPFPLSDVLPKEEIDQLYNLFEVKGISYGNLSAREDIPEFSNESTFWMTARGIDKSNITTIGQDVLLVRGIDETAATMIVSVPPVHDPRARVSVDAVEHELIYRSFPEVGAIIHAHAWIEGVPCTRQNYPCGTIELAREVVELLKQVDNPTQTAVGLKNHGLTITGHDLEDIFSRIRGKLQTEVRMFA
jgi:ribulose-5-phosphate 4-epimerase/fuculose-1-phosphate aldolase